MNTTATVLASVIATPLCLRPSSPLRTSTSVSGKEAFDLQLLAEQIGVEPGEGASPAARFQETGPRLEDLDSDDQPPYWPPPPGWKPRSQRDADE